MGRALPRARAIDRNSLPCLFVTDPVPPVRGWLPTGWGRCGIRSDKRGMIPTHPPEVKSGAIGLIHPFTGVFGRSWGILRRSCRSLRIRALHAEDLPRAGVGSGAETKEVDARGDGAAGGVATIPGHGVGAGGEAVLGNRGGDAAPRDVEDVEANGGGGRQ